MSLNFKKYMDKAGEVAEHPLVFGAGIGLANGLLAKVRGEEVPVKSMLIIGGVTAIAEAALMVKKIEKEGGSLVTFGALTGLGALAGIAAFVDWKDIMEGA